MLRAGESRERPQPAGHAGDEPRLRPLRPGARRRRPTTWPSPAEGEAFDEEYRIRTCDIGALPARRRRRPQGLRPRAGRRPCARSASRSSWATASTRPLRRGRGARWPSSSPASRSRRSCASGPQRHGSVNQGYFPVKETSDIHPGPRRGLGLLPARLRPGRASRTGARSELLAAARLRARLPPPVPARTRP